MVLLKVVALVVAVGSLVPSAAWVGLRAVRWAKAHPELAGLLLVEGYLGDEWENFRGWLGDAVDAANAPGAHHGEADGFHTADPGGADAGHHGGVDGGVDGGA